MGTITSYCKECHKKFVTRDTGYDAMILVNLHRIRIAVHFLKEHKEHGVKVVFYFLKQCVLILFKILLQLVVWILDGIAFLFEKVSDFFYYVGSMLYGARKL